MTGLRNRSISLARMLVLFGLFLSTTNTLAEGETANSSITPAEPVEPDECYDMLLEQKNRRRANVTVGHLNSDLDIGVVSEYVSLVRFVFPEIEIAAVSYSCGSRRTVTFPAHSGLAWLITIPSGTMVSVGLSDTVHSRPRSAASLLDSFLAANSEVERPRIVLSGPFWKLGRFREEPIGLIVDQGTLHQGFESDFSATQVLCADNSDHTLSLLEQPNQGNIEQDALAKCSAAIQVGPAFFEVGAKAGRVGIGGTSAFESRRNLIAQFDQPAHSSTGSRQTVLISTLTDISAFDTMVLIDAVAAQLFDGSAVRWAAGLVDDESLLGPIILSPGEPPLRLTQTNRPAGAILIFDWPD